MYVCAEKCPLTMRHMANAAVTAAEEHDCRPLLEKLRSESTREAEAEHAKRGRIRTQADHQSRTATCTKDLERIRGVGTGQSSKPRAVREKRAVHERTVRHQAVHGTP